MPTGDPLPASHAGGGGARYSGFPLIRASPIVVLLVSGIAVAHPLDVGALDLHVDGAAVTGKVTSPRGDSDITEGKIDGDTITFTQTVSFNGNDFKMTYSGKADGDTIKFTRQAGDRPAVNFVATRPK